MPNKSKFRKNRKLKSKMKGGNAEGPRNEAYSCSRSGFQEAKAGLL